MKKKWLITGGCGFLGTALIKRLIEEDCTNIRVLDNLSVGTRNDLKSVSNFCEYNFSEIKGPPKGVELIVGDILDIDIAKKISHGCDIIAHFAANTGVGPSVENPRADMLVNIVGTFNYLEAARINKIPRFIFASSGAPIGEVDPPIHEELCAHPVSPYGASKLAGEGYCLAYNKTFGVETVILRFGNVYGPGSIHKSSVIAKFILKALAGETLEIYGDGNQTRDFIYIDDLINAIMISSKHSNIGGEIFQIANNQEITISEITEILKTELAKNNINNFKIKKIQTRIGDVKRNYFNTNKAKKYLGWRPKIQLEEGLSKTISYFINSLYNKSN